MSGMVCSQLHRAIDWGSRTLPLSRRAKYQEDVVDKAVVRHWLTQRNTPGQGRRQVLYLLCSSARVLYLKRERKRNSTQYFGSYKQSNVSSSIKLRWVRGAEEDEGEKTWNDLPSPSSFRWLRRKIIKIKSKSSFFGWWLLLFFKSRRACNWFKEWK